MFAEYAEAFAVVISVTTIDSPMLILAFSAVEPLYLIFGVDVVDSAVVNRWTIPSSTLIFVLSLNLPAVTLTSSFRRSLLLFHQQDSIDPLQWQQQKH